MKNTSESNLEKLRAISQIAAREYPDILRLFAPKEMSDNELPEWFFDWAQANMESANNIVHWCICNHDNSLAFNYFVRSEIDDKITRYRGEEWWEMLKAGDVRPFLAEKGGDCYGTYDGVVCDIYGDRAPFVQSGSNSASLERPSAKAGDKIKWHRFFLDEGSSVDFFGTESQNSFWVVEAYIEPVTSVVFDSGDGLCVKICDSVYQLDKLGDQIWALLELKNNYPDHYEDVLNDYADDSKLTLDEAMDLLSTFEVIENL